MKSIRAISYIIAIIFFGITISSKSFSQDELEFRKIISGVQLKSNVLETDFKYVVKSPDYQIDFDGDGLLESFQIIKADGCDIVEIKDYNGKLLFQSKLISSGRESSVYQMNVYKLSKSAKAIVLHYYEGFNKYLTFSGSARLYFLTMDNNQLQSFKMFKGPVFWLEEKDHFERYRQRNYELNVTDYNGDGIREISVKHKKIARVYFYRGHGNWRRI